MFAFICTNFHEHIHQTQGYIIFSGICPAKCPLILKCVLAPIGQHRRWQQSQSQTRKPKPLRKRKRNQLCNYFHQLRRTGVPDNISTYLQMFEHVSNDTNITKKEIDLPKGNTRSHSIKTMFAASKKQCDINITELHPTSPASLPCTSKTPADPQDMLLDNSRDILPPTAETYSHVVGNLTLTNDIQDLFEKISSLTDTEKLDLFGNIRKPDESFVFPKSGARNGHCQKRWLDETDWLV